MNEIEQGIQVFIWILFIVPVGILLAYLVEKRQFNIGDHWWSPGGVTLYKIIGINEEDAYKRLTMKNIKTGEVFNMIPKIDEPTLGDKETDNKKILEFYLKHSKVE